MQSFDIVRESEAPDSFRAKAVIGQFDLTSDKARETFKGEFSLPDKWNIGIVYGASGTGKTTITREIFPESYITGHEYTGKCILDDMPEGPSVRDILNTFTMTGFGSIPSYLKPYSVLSNGEKMRVDLARAFLETEDMVVFDEFTSVVDRKVARSASIAIAKTIRKKDRQFIAVSCHSDILEWMEADWAFCTDDMTFTTLKKKENQSVLKSDDANAPTGEILGAIII